MCIFIIKYGRQLVKIHWVFEGIWRYLKQTKTGMWAKKKYKKTHDGYQIQTKVPINISCRSKTVLFYQRDKYQLFPRASACVSATAATLQSLVQTDCRRPSRSQDSTQSGVAAWKPHVWQGGREHLHSTDVPAVVPFVYLGHFWQQINILWSTGQIQYYDCAHQGLRTFNLSL